MNIQISIFNKKEKEWSDFYEDDGKDLENKHFGIIKKNNSFVGFYFKNGEVKYSLPHRCLDSAKKFIELRTYFSQLP